MQTVALRARDEGLDLVGGAFVDVVYFLGGDVPGAVKRDVAGVGEGKADEVEAPVAHPAEIVVGGAGGGVGAGPGAEVVEQVEASPAGDGVFDYGHGGFGKGGVAGQAEGGGGEGGVFDKVATVHDGAGAAGAVEAG